MPGEGAWLGAREGTPMLGFNHEWASTLMLVGLGCNAIGACILTFATWAALEAGGARLRVDVESQARKGRANVVNGGGLLVVGFVLQFVAAWPL